MQYVYAKQKRNNTWKIIAKKLVFEIITINLAPDSPHQRKNRIRSSCLRFTRFNTIK
jgi:hypothetical protein